MLAVLTLAALSAGVFSFVGGRAGTGTIVTRVFDGDSILISDGREIRYIGIDAPETGGNRPPEHGGIEAREINERLVLGKEVRLELDVEHEDRYGRTLAYVYAGDTMVNRELVREGAAPAVAYPPNLAHRDELMSAMIDARREGRGLWADTSSWMVDINNASSFIGESKTVVGRVLSVGEAGAGVFLNFGPDYKTDFTAFIPRKDLVYFNGDRIVDLADYYRSKTVEVTGTVVSKNGPSITVRHPDQIHIRQ